MPGGGSPPLPAAPGAQWLTHSADQGSRLCSCSAAPSPAVFPPLSHGVASRGRSGVLANLWGAVPREGRPIGFERMDTGPCGFRPLGSAPRPQVTGGWACNLGTSACVTVSCDPGSPWGRAVVSCVSCGCFCFGLGGRVPRGSGDHVGPPWSPRGGPGAGGQGWRPRTFPRGPLLVFCRQPRSPRVALYSLRGLHWLAEPHVGVWGPPDLGALGSHCWVGVELSTALATRGPGLRGPCLVSGVEESGGRGTVDSPTSPGSLPYTC